MAERLNAPVSKTSDPEPQTPSNPITYDDVQKSLTPGLPVDLVEVVRSWPELPDALKAGVMAIIRSTGK